MSLTADAEVATVLGSIPKHPPTQWIWEAADEAALNIAFQKYLQKTPQKCCIYQK